MKINKYVNQDFWAILLLPLFSFIFLYKILFLGQILTPQDSGQGDITHYAYPVLDFYSRALHQGHFPLWIDTIATGHPITAEGQIGAFFPPNLLLYSLLPTYLAFNLSYLLAFLIASYGMYLYCRFLKLKALPSLLGAITFSYSFVFISHMLTINVLQSIAFLPILVLFGEKLFLNGKKQDFIVFSVLLALQLLAGFPQTTFYTIVAIFVLILFKYFKTPHIARKLIVLLGASFVSLLISAVQNIPMIELFLNSTRFGVSSQGISAPFSILDLSYIIHPYIWGDPSTASYIRSIKDGLFWENNFYFGLIPLALVVAGCFLTSKVKVLKPYFYLSVLTLLFSLGVLSLLNFIPPFSFFRLPQRSLFVAVFGFSIISAYVFQHFFSKLKLSLQLLILILAFLNLFFLGKDYNGGISKEKFLKKPSTVMFLQSQNVKGRIFTLANASDWNRVYTQISHGWQSPTAEILLQNRSLLHPNSNVLYDIPSFYGYNVFRLRTTNDMNSLAFYGSSLDASPLYISTTSAKLLGLSSVEYVISPEAIGSENSAIALVWKDKNMNGSTYFIYKNNKFEPIIRYSKTVKSFPTIQEQARYLLSNEFDSTLESTTLGFPGVFEYSKGKILNINKSFDKLSFDTISTGSAFITISQTVYPGWKAKNDESEVPISNVNINSIGIQVPSGKHKIELYYDPFSFKLGLFVTLLTMGALITVLFKRK